MGKENNGDAVHRKPVFRVVLREDSCINVLARKNASGAQEVSPHPGLPSPSTNQPHVYTTSFFKLLTNAYDI